jgi:hypothetical protein
MKLNDIDDIKHAIEVAESGCTWEEFNEQTCGMTEDEAGMVFLQHSTLDEEKIMEALPLIPIAMQGLRTLAMRGVPWAMRKLGKTRLGRLAKSKRAQGAGGYAAADAGVDAVTGKVDNAGRQADNFGDAFNRGYDAGGARKYESTINELTPQEEEQHKDNPAMLKALRSIEKTFGGERKQISDQITAMCRAADMLTSDRFKDRALSTVEQYGIKSKEELVQELQLMIQNEKQVDDDEIVGPDMNIKSMERALDKIKSISEQGYDTKDFEFNPRAGHRDQLSHPENRGLGGRSGLAPATSPRPKLRPKNLKAPMSSPRPKARPANLGEAGGYYTQPVYDMIEKHGYEKVMSELLSKLDADVIQDFLNRAELNEGPFTGVGKMMMKQKLKKQHKKSDLANFDKSGIDTSGKTPDEIGQMKSDYYHDNMDKAARAKKAGNRLGKNVKYGIIRYPDTAISYIKNDGNGWEHIYDKSYGFKGSVDKADLKYAKKIDIDRIPSRMLEDVTESEEKPYICVHAKKGKHECHADSSYGAAKKAAAHWGMKSTAGIDAHLAVEEEALTEAQFDEAAGEKDACYRKVKSRYKVWPSAYASGALVKCRKVGAANWGNSGKK